MGGRRGIPFPVPVGEGSAFRIFPLCLPPAPGGERPVFSAPPCLDKAVMMLNFPGDMRNR
ncbi:MAG: hypothetical protein DRH56_01775 [Deltaproteobacteria bacterium]|nr:MAG: hypothetical protein DRH56_01775 [Deltaproteobacteria bacterium]